jgi:glycosyltransferase involved in cell wall biosynthesis
MHQDTNRRPLVSIVIDNYNYARYLAQAIDSALDQSYTNTEVIVVDDGSTDDSRDVIAAYAAAVTAVSQDNSGQASALNAGFRRSRGSIVCFLDADDALLPDTVERVVDAFRDPELAKVHWAMWEIDAAGRRTSQLRPPFELPEGDLRTRVIECGPASYESPPLSGNAWARQALARMLPIPERPFKAFADTYLFSLIAMFGRIGRLPRAGGLYRLHGSNESTKALETRLPEFLSRFDYRCEALATVLRELGLEPDVETWKRNSEFYQRMLKTSSAVTELSGLVPRGGSFILVDGNEWPPGEVLVGTRAIPFLERDGEYFGPPADSATAIRELERLRQQGAAMLAIAWPAFWWLDYYAEFAAHLHEKFRRALANERLVVFDLRP